MITTHEARTQAIIGAAIEVHRHLGPGLLETVYARCLCHELCLRDIPWRSEVPVAIGYKGLLMETAFRADLVVDEVVLVETKVVASLLPVHEAQALTYMRLLNLPVGLLLNFNVPLMRDWIRRLILPEMTNP